MPTEPTGRRPLKTRDWPFFKKLAAWLARSGVTPNGISFSSIVFGGAAGVAFALTTHLDGWALRGSWLAAAMFIQLRLIANLLDGMVAVEGGKGGPTGDIWNEAPDRISDAAILIGAGYAAGSFPVSGYLAAVVALFVAYVRALGASCGIGQIFLGPMAKPHRMALLTFAAVFTAIFPSGRLWNAENTHPTMIFSALNLVILGGAYTAYRRTKRMADTLREKAKSQT